MDTSWSCKWLFASSSRWRPRRTPMLEICLIQHSVFPMSTVFVGFILFPPLIVSRCPCLSTRWRYSSCCARRSASFPGLHPPRHGQPQTQRAVQTSGCARICRNTGLPAHINQTHTHTVLSSHSPTLNTWWWVSCYCSLFKIYINIYCIFWIKSIFYNILFIEALELFFLCYRVLQQWQLHTQMHWHMTLKCQINVFNH